MPLICNYYVTLRCNQRCVFCNIPHTNAGRPDREPSPAQLVANLRDLKRLGVRLLDVTGGEPLLYRHVIGLLTLAKRSRLRTTLTTNGMLYPKFAKALAGKVDALLFSVESPDAAEHDRIRATPSFQLVMEALRLARHLKQDLFLSHVVTDESVDRVDEMVRFARQQRAILFLNPCFSFFGNGGLAPERAQELHQYVGQRDVIVDRAQLRLIASGGNDPAAPICRAVTSSVVLSPDNRLWLPCYHFRQAGIPIENNLYDVYTKHPAVQDARRTQGTHAFCTGCTVYCYMRSSLGWKYPIDTAALAAHYVRERVRQRVKRALGPPEAPPADPSGSVHPVVRMTAGADRAGGCRPGAGSVSASAVRPLTSGQ